MSEVDVAVKVEEISPVKKKILFDIPWMDVKKELDAVYRNVAKSAKIKGFRQGRIPREVLEVYYKESAEGETISNLLKKFYRGALEEEDIIPVTQPHIDQGGIEKNKNFTFTATVEVEPVIEPNDYTGLELEMEGLDITERDVEERLQQIRQMFASLEEVGDDRGVMEGDFTTLDFEGTAEGEPLKGLKAEDYTLEVGSKTFLPGFEEQLIGMKRGEPGQIRIKFPDDHHIEHLAGKEVIFSVNLKSIKEKKLPELDENFIRNFDKFESMEELKEDIRKSLEEENKVKADLALKDLVVSKLLEANEFEVPPSFVEGQIFYMMADTQQRMILSGMDRKEAAELSLQFRDHFRDEATTIVKSGFLLKSIARKESLTVDEKEVEDHLRDMAREHAKEYESLRESYEKNGRIDYIRNEILNKKVFDFIKGTSKITVVKKTETKKEEKENI
ncbi:MAG: trigger factor [Syntrophales bacterium]|nr:trigger factor [Syntrophales bacterium]